MDSRDTHHMDCQFGHLFVANCCQNNDEFLASLSPDEVKYYRAIDKERQAKIDKEDMEEQDANTFRCNCGKEVKEAGWCCSEACEAEEAERDYQHNVNHT